MMERKRESHRHVLRPPDEDESHPLLQPMMGPEASSSENVTQAPLERADSFGRSVMIHRPLVFGQDVPAVMINRDQVRRFTHFFSGRRVPFETRPFQESFEMICFPTLSSDDVENLLDQLTRTTGV